MITEHLNDKLHFSILTPVRNGAAFVEDLINSVLQQDYADYEHIIIDDGSNDDGATANTLRRYPHLKWKSQINVGQYPTQNELIKMASGDVVSIICADDLYATTTVLSSIAKRFAAKPDLEVVIGRTRRLVEKDGIRYVFDPDLPAFLARKVVRYSLNIQHCAVFVRRRLLEDKNLYFDTYYKMRGDWDWIIRLLAATTKVEYTNEVLAIWRLHERQMSRTGQTGEIEVRRLCGVHGISYRLHRAVHYGMNRLGMICAAYSLGRQVGVAAAMRATISHARRAISGARNQESS